MNPDGVLTNVGGEATMRGRSSALRVTTSLQNLKIRSNIMAVVNTRLLLEIMIQISVLTS